MPPSLCKQALALRNQVRRALEESVRHQNAVALLEIGKGPHQAAVWAGISCRATGRLRDALAGNDTAALESLLDPPV